MKNMIFNIGIIAMLLSCGSSKTITNPVAISIQYNVIQTRVFADSIWHKAKAMPLGMKKTSALKNLHAIEAPGRSHYRLLLTDSVSQLSYIPPLELHPDAHYKRQSHPFSSYNSYRFLTKSGSYLDFSSAIPQTYVKKPDQPMIWRDMNRDSVILGIKVHLVKGLHQKSIVKAWVTDKYPQQLGVFDLHYNQGFILAYTYINNHKAPFKRQTLKVFPERIKTLSKVHFRVPTWKKGMTLQQAKTYIQNHND